MIKRRRQAGGLGALSAEVTSNPLLPIAAGLAASLGTAWTFTKVRGTVAPFLVGSGIAAAGAATAWRAQTPWIREVGLGVAVGVGSYTLLTGIGTLLAKEQEAKHTPAKKEEKQRAAEGDGYVTRQELQAALSQVADGQKQTQCDVVAALHEIKQTMAAMSANDNGRAKPSPSLSPPPSYATKPPANDNTQARDASGYDERDAAPDERDAYAYVDERDAAPDERDAYAYVDERDAAPDERDAYAYVDERDAAPDERDAYVDERDAYAYVDERDAAPDERDADADERDADADERDASPDEDRATP